MKVFKFFEYAYLAIMCFFLYQAYADWGSGEGRSYMYIVFACIAVFMFFFKRNFRKKFDANNKD
ncbi:hypothetical protein D1816_20305 [Aquimarina sp. AD10]|uniref:Uncharacterized protein n=1 Tax=Aquimarina aggregata TaxID=1642818 RepID=A0A163D3X4_9FLAO|nr:MULTISPECIES: hypothetical protein [Aquimarina]AXT62600.1 hypothetical protein D1816_20305 [Aquimarina sp. AD10]KZS42976.1 hypothetical protein AWE51_16650 [Aquimarina aggregata]RKM97784.1 hypothetical protein D7033_13615 [Aquimarina sp. AD10]